ncbi:hypothetical protein AB0F30_36395 [Streptomyces sp. NPDC029006]|uniref:hypothetical protein n=1 Tax=Streptomyces sp. NPDC029006 TaxID=3155467 RepID=UPI0033EE236F
MNHRETDTGRPDRTAGMPAGQAVWETELPWQLAPLGEAGQNGSAFAGDIPHHDPAARDAGTAVSPAVPVPSSTDGAASAPLAPMTEARGHGAEPAVPGGRRRRDRSDRVASGGRGAEGDGRAGLRLALAKPVLAGAGVLSALFLLAPAMFGEDAHSHTFKAGAGDTGEDYAPDEQYPAAGSTVSPRPGASRTPEDDRAAAGKPHRIAEVAAASPTKETRVVEPMSQSHAPVPSRTPRSGGTPRTSSTPRQQQQPSQQHWTTTVVNGTSVLEPGQSWSTNRVMLAFQGDGNLVLYDTKGTPLWWSGTVGQGAKAVFQADGNFAVYTQDGATAWSSRTDGHDGAQLVLGANGNVTIRSGGAVLWSTGTAM